MTAEHLVADGRFGLDSIALQTSETDRRYAELWAKWITLQSAVLVYDDAVQKTGNQQWDVEDLDKLYDAMVRAARRER